MFSTFKKLFGMQEAAVMQQPAPSTRLAPPVQQRPRTEPTLRAQPNVSGVINVSIGSIIARLPKELTQRVVQADAGGAEIAIPLQRILSQIATGAVKITFGELRQAAPVGTFSHENDRDRASVDIPLNEILPRMDHALLPRRASQRQVVVPNEVLGPFGGQTQINFTTTPLKAGTPAQPVPAIAASTGGTTRMYRREVTPAPVAPAPVAPVAAPAPVPTPVPVARVRPPQPSVAPVNPVRPAAPQAAPAPKAPVIVPFQPGAKPAPAPAAAPVPARPAYAFQPSNGHAHAAPPVRPAAPPPNVVPFQPAPVPEAEPVEDGSEQDVPQFTGAEEMVPQSPLSFTPPTARSQPAVPYQASPAMPAAPASPIITPIAPEPDEPAPIRFTRPPEPAPAAAAPAPIPAPAPTPAAPAMPSIAGETRFLTLAISDVGGCWPAPIQQEIMAHQLTSSSVALPFGVIELALKQGKVALPWRVLRTWIKPPAHITTSPNDAVMLELPLKIIAPRFMAEMKAAKPQKKVAVDENIPALFSNRTPAEPPMAVVPGAVASAASAAPSMVPLQPPQPTPISAIPSRAADTNYFARPNGDHPEEAAPPVKKGASPGTAFLQRYATPNEIVGKAAALEGVDGALIALPDGLQVASRVPANMNADTIAGFLPQIFNRISQCTKELRMGELNNLSFTVGNVPWKMFKVGAIFFAAFGRPGSALPTAQLAGIAAELDRKAK